MTDDEKKTLRELEQQFFNLSSDLDMLGNNARLIADNADNLRATLHDLCYKLKISDEWTE